VLVGLVTVLAGLVVTIAVKAVIIMCRLTIAITLWSVSTSSDVPG